MIKKAFISFRFTGFTLALLMSVGLALAYYYLHEQFTLLESFENKTLDLRFKVRGPRPTSGNVVIVTVDDYSIEALGKWPWPRSYHGYLLDALTADGAKVVGFDIIISEPELSREAEQLWALRQHFATLSVSANSREGREFGLMMDQAIDALDTDRILVESAKRNGNAVASFVFQNFAEVEGRATDIGPEPMAPGDMPPPGLAPDAQLMPEEVLAMSHGPAFVGGEREQFRMPVALDALLPITGLMRNAKRMGFVNLFVDVESIPRWDVSFIEFGGMVYPSFSLQIVKEFMGLRDEGVRIEPGHGIRIGEIDIPTDEYGRALMNYYGPKNTFPYISYSDVLEGLVPPGTFAGKAVLVGTAATGLGDLWPTPFSKDMPGVEKHAIVIDNMLQGAFLERDGTTRLIDVLFILFMGIALGYCLPRLSPAGSVLFSILLLLITVVVNYLIFARLGMWLNLIYPTFSLFFISLGLVTYKLFTEEKEKRVVKKAFKQYLNPTLVDELVKHPDSLRLGGEAKELTVLFSDIRGFTSIAERLEPEKLVSFLNDYLSSMTAIVMENNGLVDKFIGDAIMSIYGAPLHMPDHPTQACGTAVAMVEELRIKNTEWVSMGLPEIRIGIGINTGIMVAGNMGSKDRFDYTVMGDSVNLASRLEGLNKTYGTSIIISEFTAAKVEGFVLRELDLVRVVGRGEPIKVYEVLGRAGEVGLGEAEYEKYYEGLDRYRKREFERAHTVFKTLYELYESPLYGLYAGRCEEFMAAPPPENWDGVYTFTRK